MSSFWLQIFLVCERLNPNQQIGFQIFFALSTHGTLLNVREYFGKSPRMKLFFPPASCANSENKSAGSKKAQFVNSELFYFLHQCLVSMSYDFLKGQNRLVSVWCCIQTI
jgi:hypothetical protein